MLNDLHICWKDSTEPYTWEDMFSFAEQFYHEHGHLVVPSGYLINGVWIARWVSRQRQRYTGKTQPPLSEEQIAGSESIGMFWGSLSERKWREQYKEAVTYYEEHGDIRIPENYISPKRQKNAELDRQPKEKSKMRQIN